VTLLVLVLLAVVWVAVLVPPWVRSFREGRPGDSIHSFRKQLVVLERTGAVPLPAYRRPTGSAGMANGSRGTVTMQRPAQGLYAPARRSPVSSRARQRRRQVLLMLVGLTFVTGTLALAARGVMLYAFVMSGLMLIGYVSLLVQQQRTATMYSASSRYRSAA
jgi:hypothetical protein